MRLKHHILLYTFLSVAVLLSIYLALDYGIRAQRSAQALEDAYAQRVLETQEHLQAIGLKLGKAPVAADARTQVELLAGISRQADSVVSGLSALPLSHIAMSDTLKFCNQLSEYAMVLALSVAAGQPLTEQETAELVSLESQCALLTGQFATARETMVAESLRLTARPGVFYAEAQAAQRPLEQVADPDNGMDYPSMIYDGAFSDARHYGSPKALGEGRIDQRQAMEAARAFVGEERVRSVEAAPDSGGALASYGVKLTLNDGVVLNAEVTRQGGKMLWMVPEHAAFEPGWTLEECAEAARDFLLDRGYGEMEANHYQVYDGLAVINFVAVQDGVLLYPDLVKVQVRMDTGEVVGLEANNYLMNHTERTGLSPALSGEQALEKASSRLEAGQARLCVIPYREGERLCYEVPGRYEGREYRVYIDAITGEEAEVLMMVDSVGGRMAA
ncbi:MAG TPA: germination protein YpeB [Candidatus Limiplasma pullistercoris]|nr:germination protein YpeB [Candidatus Limiplasma pullistercoris]